MKLEGLMGEYRKEEFVCLCFASPTKMVEDKANGMYVHSQKCSIIQVLR